MNMLSNEFKQSLYTPTGLIDLGTRLGTTAGAIVSHDPNGERITAALSTAIDNLIAANERERANPVTARINDMRNIRNDNLRMLGYRIMANARNTLDETVRKAAETLLPVFNLHAGRSNTRSNAAMSSAVAYLIERLMSDELRPLGELVGIIPIVEALEKVQHDLEALYTERSQVTADLKKFTLTCTGDAACDAIRTFLGYVDVLVTGNGEGTAELYEKTKQIIGEVEALARMHRTRAHGSEEEQPEEKEELQKAA
jgi:hypothetical protein